MRRHRVLRGCFRSMPEPASVVSCVLLGRRDGSEEASRDRRGCSGGLGPFLWCVPLVMTYEILELIDVVTGGARGVRGI